MESTLKATPTSELERLCNQPASAGSYSPLTGYPLLLLDMLPGTQISAEQQQSLAKIVRYTSCPVIALAPPDLRSALTDEVDVVVSSYREARTLANNIAQQPLTAMTLVQVLRHNESASLEGGLLAESLAFASLQAGTEFNRYLANRATPSAPEPDSQPAVLLERQENCLILTLNRPQQHNAYTAVMRDALFEALQLQASDPSIRRTIIRGAGGCFCIGGALEEFGLTEDVSAAHAIRCARHVGRLIASMAERVECHVHKACIGSGIELPAFAGHITAAKNTFFQLPEITMGLIPGAGGTVSILRRIGRQRTAYMALSAKRIKAQTALEWGLVDAID